MVGKSESILGCPDFRSFKLAGGVIMTVSEKNEMAEIVSSAVIRALEQHCPMGLQPETVHELIIFAQTWKTCRKVMITGAAATLITAFFTALWAGIKTILHR